MTGSGVGAGVGDGGVVGAGAGEGEGEGDGDGESVAVLFGGVLPPRRGGCFRGCGLVIERPSLLKKSPTGSAFAGVALIPSMSTAASVTTFCIMTFKAPTLCMSAARSSNAMHPKRSAWPEWQAQYSQAAADLSRPDYKRGASPTPLRTSDRRRSPRA